MKKINSIHYGGKIILIGSIIAFFIPLLLLAINSFVKVDLIRTMIWSCIGIGCLILTLFLIFLSFELLQDRKLENYYTSHRNIKIAQGNNIYECASCGNRSIKKQDKSCPICGVRFSEEEDRSVQEVLNRKKRKKK